MLIAYKSSFMCNCNHLVEPNPRLASVFKTSFKSPDAPRGKGQDARRWPAQYPRERADHLRTGIDARTAPV